MTIKDYIEIVSKRFQSDITKKHSNRGNLENLIRTLVQGVEKTNEPAIVTNRRNSTYDKTTNEIPIDDGFSQEIMDQIAKKLDLTFVPEQEAEGNVCFANSNELRDDYKISFAPIDILDYIYAVLHSPTYREKYKEFLEIDLPRVPYPKDTETFWQLVKLGGELRQVHLLECPKVEDYSTSYPKSGDNKITRKMTKTSIGFEPVLDISANASTRINNRDFISSNSRGKSELYREDVIGKVWINDEQYFDNVPLVAWEFYIGGYQPAQKWLKDRRDNVLTSEDINHYQKIIKALSETDRIMKEIDNIKID